MTPRRFQTSFCSFFSRPGFRHCLGKGGCCATTGKFVPVRTTFGLFDILITDSQTVPGRLESVGFRCPLSPKVGEVGRLERAEPEGARTSSRRRWLPPQSSHSSDSSPVSRRGSTRWEADPLSPLSRNPTPGTGKKPRRPEGRRGFVAERSVRNLPVRSRVSVCRITPGLSRRCTTVRRRIPQVRPGSPTAGQNCPAGMGRPP